MSTATDRIRRNSLQHKPGSAAEASRLAALSGVGKTSAGKSIEQDAQPGAGAAPSCAHSGLGLVGAFAVGTLVGEVVEHLANTPNGGGGGCDFRIDDGHGR